MDSILHANFRFSTPLPTVCSAVHRHSPPCLSLFPHPFVPTSSIRRRHFAESLRPAATHSYADAGTTNSMPPRDRTYSVGDFMTRKDDLHVVRPYTTVEEALEILVEKRITGFPVIDDDWKLLSDAISGGYNHLSFEKEPSNVGVVSDYDLLALDSISGGGQADTNLFPDVDSTWKTFSEIQKLLGKTNGKVVGDLMTPAPLVVHESTNLEDAARLLLETKYRRLPVVDSDGKLVGIITRGDVVRAALQIKHASERM